jgi:hypothetical protein
LRRVNFFIIVALIALSLAPAPLKGQQWSGILNSSRAIDWSNAGAGTIPNRTTTCATLSAGASLAAVNAAIAACPANQVVSLAAGNYSFGGQILFSNVNNVTLRGAGPDQTFIQFTAQGGCTGLHADVCVVSGDTGDFAGAPSNVATWTGGYTQGTNTITLGAVTTGSVSNLKVGSLLILDQLDDSSDTGNMFVCSASGSNGTCSQQGSVGNGRTGRGQNQTVTVTSISGSGPWTIGISPGVYAPNWRSSQSPQVWWANGLPASGIGIENLSLNHSGSNGSGVYGMGIQFVNATNSWVSNVRSLNDQNGVSEHMEAFQSAHITLQNNYLYGSNPASEGYGLACDFSSSDVLIVNNVLNHVAAPLMTQGCTGSVFAYNYAVDDYFGPGAWQGEDSHHSVGDEFNLYEGNETLGLSADDIHGTSYALTFFRNYYSGRDPATANGTKSEATIPLWFSAYNRYYNVVGNVLGTSGYHNTYQVQNTSTTDCGPNPWTTIYSFGYSNQNQVAFTPACIGSGFIVYNDSIVHASTMRFDNYDVVTGATRACTGPSVPSSFCTEDELADNAPSYPGLSSPSSSLPPSFFLSSKPAWWGSSPWPANGPDISSGNISNVGGHANLIPAANCYLNVMGGLTNGSSGALTFNANNCYSTSSSSSGPPAPQNLSGTVVQ